MKILVLGRTVHPDGKETALLIANSLREILQKHDDTVLTFSTYKQVLFDISVEKTEVFVGKTQENIDEFDVIFMTNWFSHASIRKDIALAIALVAKERGIKLFNSEALYSRSTSKLSQMIIAAQNEVAVPRTIFSLDMILAKNYIHKIGIELPLIAKDAQASRGKNNYKITNIEELEEIKANHTEKTPYLLQCMIESDGSDDRFFMVNGKVKLVIRRKGAEGSHLNNTSQGGTATLISLEDISQTVLNIAEKMSKLLHREITGLDIMYDLTNNGSPVFLEANPIPQIATGSFVAEKLNALAEGLMEA